MSRQKDRKVISFPVTHLQNHCASLEWRDNKIGSAVESG